MDGDEVGGRGELAVAQPEFPDVGIGDGHFHPRLDRAQRGGEVFRRHFAAQQHLVAHHHGADGVRIAVGQLDRGIDLLAVQFGVARQPQALHHLEAVAGGDTGDLVLTVIGRIRAHAVGDLGEPR